MKKRIVILILLSVLTARADLKTWLHGAPPAPSPGPPDAKAAAVSVAPNVTADKPILDFMNLFAEAMRVHDGKAIKPILSDSYSIDGLPAELKAADYFMQAMVKLKAPDEIVIAGITREGETRIVKTEFRSAERGAKERTFKFDAGGKLLNVDFFAATHQ